MFWDGVCGGLISSSRSRGNHPAHENGRSGSRQGDRSYLWMTGFTTGNFRTKLPNWVKWAKKLAVAEGFEPYSITWSAGRNGPPAAEIHHYRSLQLRVTVDKLWAKCGRSLSHSRVATSTTSGVLCAHRPSSASRWRCARCRRPCEAARTWCL